MRVGNHKALWREIIESVAHFTGIVSFNLSCLLFLYFFYLCVEIPTHLRHLIWYVIILMMMIIFENIFSALAAPGNSCTVNSEVRYCTVHHPTQNTNITQFLICSMSKMKIITLPVCSCYCCLYFYQWWIWYKLA